MANLLYFSSFSILLIVIHIITTVITTFVSIVCPASSLGAQMVTPIITGLFAKKIGVKGGKEAAGEGVETAIKDKVIGVISKAWDRIKNIRSDSTTGIYTTLLSSITSAFSGERGQYLLVMAIAFIAGISLGDWLFRNNEPFIFDIIMYVFAILVFYLTVTKAYVELAAMRGKTSKITKTKEGLERDIKGFVAVTMGFVLSVNVAMLSPDIGVQFIVSLIGLITGAIGFIGLLTGKDIPKGALGKIDDLVGSMEFGATCWIFIRKWIWNGAPDLSFPQTPDIGE